MASRKGPNEGWGPVFAKIEEIIDHLCPIHGQATRDAIAGVLSTFPEILGSKNALNSVDWFSAKFTEESPLLANAISKFDRYRVNGTFTYFLKGETPPSAPDSEGAEESKAGPAPVADLTAAAAISATGTVLPRFGSGTTSALLNDAAITSRQQDRLGFETTAETIASFMAAERTATPLVLAINAPWGAGKSSLVNLILHKLERRLDLEGFYRFLRRRPRLRKLYEEWRTRQPGSGLEILGRSIRFARPRNLRQKHTVLRFDAWMHDDAPQITTAFASAVVRRASSARSLAAQIMRPVSYRYSGRVARAGTLAAAILAILFLGSVFYQLIAWKVLSPATTLELEQGIVHMLEKSKAGVTAGLPALIGVLALVGKQLKEFLDTVQKYLNDPEKAAEQGNLAKVNERLRGLFQQATTGRRKFIIYIDNLERCKPENALAILEVVNQLLGHPMVVTIIAADMELIAASAGSRFKEQAKLLADGESTEAGICLEFGRRYVRKMVQLTVQVPRPSKRQLGELTCES